MMGGVPTLIAAVPWATANDIYSSPAFLAGTAILLAVWTLRVCLPAWRAGRRLQAALTDMRSHLVRAGDAIDVARNYTDLKERFRADALVGSAWNRLDQTLLKPDADGKPYRQTTPARDFLNTNLLRSAGVDVRAYRAQASTLVGIGLLLTFIGLVIALKAAGGTLAANDPGEVQEGLRALLDAAGSKFSFSVVGLSLSLLSAASLRRLMRGTDAALASLIEAVDKRLPPLTAVEVAVGTQLLLRAAVDAQGAAMAAAVDQLGLRFDAALSKRLSEATAPMADAISRMTGNIGESNRHALQEMADRFAARLEAVAAEEIREATLAMERVGAHVTALAETLDGVRDKFGRTGEAAATDIANAASDAARRIADAAEATRGALQAAGPEWERASAAAADLLRACLAEAAKDFAASVKRGGEQLEEGGRKLSERLARAASDAGREIRSAGTALGAAGDAAGAAVDTAAQQAAVQVTAATGAVSSQAAQVAVAFAGIDATLRALASSLVEARRTATISANLVERAALQFNAAAERFGSLPAAALVLDELRASATRVSSAADALATRVAAASPASEGTPAAEERAATEFAGD